MNISFAQLVKEHFENLSPGQKKVAEYLLQQLEEAAFRTAVQIGRKVQVSETTVTRLSYALGFSGFSQMQSFIQRQIVNGRETVVEEKMDYADDSLAPFVELIQNDISILKQTVNQLDLVNLLKVADALLDADQILVIGSRSSYGPAHWFSFMLSTFREHVSLSEPKGLIYEKICDLTDKSVVFVISFPRYTKETIEIAENAKQLGAKIISVTDLYLSPVGRISDITLITEENIGTGTDSIVPVIGLLDLILLAVSRRNPSQIQKRKQRLERLYTSGEVFLE
ncbi:MurR/RpiR family transcriptional regulator [Shimazuella kribbensis]|uniref:MurR/RpiR family transcriptional regulator n=1 Tax=Shimazuella kribbensis TaxID=139808 RepID=UPI0004134B81|nr:MurR/RpiR family transcriptional regulator [Shimazuella kribbensis]